eukprot:1400365-Prymnesium_polylepis.1
MSYIHSARGVDRRVEDVPSVLLHEPATRTHGGLGAASAQGCRADGRSQDRFLVGARARHGRGPSLALLPARHGSPRARC